LLDSSDSSENSENNRNSQKEFITLYAEKELTTTLSPPSLRGGQRRG